MLGVSWIVTGELRFKHPTNNGYFTMTAPIAWQEIDGKRKPVKVAFNKYDERIIGFSIEEYNRSYPLIIDPTYQWHTFYGSGSSDIGWDYTNGITVDVNGNVYVTGYSFTPWNGDAGQPPINAYSGPYDDIFVLKLDSSGRYQWHTFYGSAGWKDHGYSIAVDASGNVYVTGASLGGSTGSWNGDNDTPPIHAYSGGWGEIFILKLDSQGKYQWHTFYGAGNRDGGNGIAVDTNGNVYVTGGSGAWDGDAGQAPIHAHNGAYYNYDTFVLKLDSQGKYQWHTFHNFGYDYEYGAGIAIDTSGNVYVTGASLEGSTGSLNGDNNTPPIHAHSGGLDIFVFKLDSQGKYQWHTFYGSVNWEGGSDIAVDTSGNVYVTGDSRTSWNGDNNTAPIHSHSGWKDIFVLKFNPDGVYQWHTFYGSDNWYIDDVGKNIILDKNWNVYVTGISSQWNGDNNTVPKHVHSGEDDIFVLKLDSQGKYQWHTFYGSAGNDEGKGIAADTSGNVYVIGESWDAWTGDTGQNPLHTYSEVADILVMKLNDYQAGNPLTDNTAFIQQQYRDFLGREAEENGLSYWLNELNTGHLTKAQVINSFMWSDEFGNSIAPIARLYFAYFLRIPDYDGMMYWINQAKKGMSLNDISTSFTQSEEFQSRYGNLSNEQFVTLVYQNVLGREPDANGKAYWLDHLDRGIETRGQVMVGFSESEEYKNMTSNAIYVTMAYMGMLRRAPEQTGFDYWVNDMNNGRSGVELIQGFLDSEEYARRFQ